MNAQIQILNEVDSIEFDTDKFNSLEYSDQLEFVVRKMSFIRKNILTNVSA